jgi:hypothetical protein
LKVIAGLKNNSVIINSFFDAKFQELINIFSEGSKQEKQEAFSIMSALDPDKTEAYRKLMK